MDLTGLTISIPKVPQTAVLLATHNGEEYLSEMLRSLELQSYQDFVCCIHDDGSTDRTRKIIFDYVVRSPRQFCILDYPAQGSAKANFLSMLEHVEADYYLYADQDDVWLPEKINAMMNEMVQLENEEFFIQEESKARVNDHTMTVADPTHTPLLVYSDMIVVDKDMSVISDSFHRYIGRNPYRLRYQDILIDNPAAGCSMMFNRALRNKVIEYTDVSEIEMHDSWTLLLASLFGIIKYMDAPLLCYRQHDDNEMGAKRSETTGERVRRNLSEIFSGRFFRDKKEFHDRMRKNAHQLLQVSGLSEETRRTLTEFCDLSKKSKGYRMRFYKDHGFKRQKNDLWFRLTC